MQRVYLFTALLFFLRRSVFWPRVYEFLPWAVACFLIGLIFKWMFNEYSGGINDLLLKAEFIHDIISWLGDKNVSLIVPIVGMIWYGITFLGV